MDCPICGSKENFLAEDLQKTPPYKAFYSCSDCGVVFADPMVAGTESYYEDSYGALAGGYSEEKWEFKKVFEVIDSLRLGERGRDILDVACGPGWFLKMAESRGFEAYGIDFNRQAVDYARNRLGLKNVIFGDIPKDLSVFNRKFDFAVLIHILEHVENPVHFIKKMSEVIKEGGFLVVDLPNSRRSVLGFNFRKWREGWDYPPHHLTRWNIDSLSVFLEKMGFEVVVAEEEVLRNFSQIFKFVEAIFQLNTTTGLIRKSYSEDGGFSTGKGSRFFSEIFVKTLSIIKKTISSFVAGMVFPFAYLLSRFLDIKGTNLFLLARKK